MAIVQNLLIGRAKGRVGNVVFSTHKGKNILKAKAEIVANPRTGQQQANRAKFSALLALGRVLRPILALGFKEYAGSVSWLNRFMSTNSYSDVLVWAPASQTWEVQLEYVVVSEGQLLPTPLIVFGNSVDSFGVEWSVDTLANQASNDLFIGVAMCGNQTVYSIKTTTRAIGAESFIFDNNLPVGANLYYAGFFISNDGRIVSNSYAGVHIVTA